MSSIYKFLNFSVTGQPSSLFPMYLSSIETTWVREPRVPVINASCAEYTSTSEKFFSWTSILFCLHKWIILDRVMPVSYTHLTLPTKA